MLAATRRSQQKVYGGLPSCDIEQTATATKIAGGSKTVTTAQIAVMGNVQTQGFNLRNIFKSFWLCRQGNIKQPFITKGLYFR